ncbi:MAG: type II toxin-antitoxin system ParD family antitoxin [Gammaproteobacteria bacterium]|nr:type II toxin-antitoxin system ParD family antitoxin [Gammaproteobacteria bacterium]MCY4229267.1 type II toxin-antitoxin system ParD family antitoxin [Gammaproteobacteria bacterium]
MSDWVEAQIEAGRYHNASEYFHDLVRHDQDRNESTIQELRNIMNRAEASGITNRTLPDIVKTAKSKARKKGLIGRNHR